MGIFNETEEETIKRIDDNTKLIQNEYLKHAKEVLEIHPDYDEKLIFRSWLIQKISFLQVSVIDIAEKIQMITTYIKNK